MFKSLIAERGCPDPSEDGKHWSPPKNARKFVWVGRRECGIFSSAHIAKLMRTYDIRNPGPPENWDTGHWKVLDEFGIEPTVKIPGTIYYLIPRKR